VVASQVEDLGGQRRLDVEVERRRRVERGRDVDLNQPGFQFRVEEDVESEELVADVVGVHVGAVNRVDCVLGADDGLDDLKSFNKFQ
jgi:hypothetical protein